jgi:primary-amine oxidase
MNLKPADFFTSNPALDVPPSGNEESVLVPCCDLREKTNGADQPTSDESVQNDPLSHAQGPGKDIDARAVGATVEGQASK